MAQESLVDKVEGLYKQLEPDWELTDATDLEDNANGSKVSAQGCNPQTPSC